MRWSWLVACACAGGEPVDDGRDDPVDPDPVPDPDPEPCEATLLSVFPEDAAVSVARDVAVDLTFSAPIAADQFTVEISDAAGPVSGLSSLAADGRSASWTADVELAPSQTYTVDVNVCSTLATSSFTTIGESIDVLALAGQTYGVSWSSLTFVEPPNAQVFLGTPVDDVLLQIVSVDATTLQAEAAAAGALDPEVGTFPVAQCNTLVQQTIDLSNNPFVEFGPQDVSLATGGVALDVEDLRLSGELADDGDRIVKVELTGLLATEGLIGDACAASTLVALLQGNCLPCASSPSGSCLELLARAPEAAEILGYSLVDACP